MISTYHNIIIPGSSDSWAVITVEKKSDAMAFIYNSYKYNFIIGLILLALAVLIMSFISKTISIPIKKSSDYVNLLANGDLSTEFSTVGINRRDEIGIIIGSISQMKETLNCLISNIESASSDIEKHVDTIMESITNLKQNLEDVSSTTQELAVNMEETAATSDQMTTTATEIQYQVRSLRELVPDPLSTTQTNPLAQRLLIDKVSQQHYGLCLPLLFRSVLLLDIFSLNSRIFLMHDHLYFF